MDIPFEKVSIKEAQLASDGPAASANPSSDLQWADRRSTVEAEPVKISAEVITWLHQLPLAVRPRNLAIAYPRIFNKIALLAPRPLQYEKYLDELLLDRRGTRKGFPPAVASELHALKAHFVATRHMVHYDVWGERIGDDQ